MFSIGSDILDIGTSRSRFSRIGSSFHADLGEKNEFMLPSVANVNLNGSVNFYLLLLTGMSELFLCSQRSIAGRTSALKRAKTTIKTSNS